MVQLKSHEPALSHNQPVLDSPFACALRGSSFTVRSLRQILRSYRPSPSLLSFLQFPYVMREKCQRGTRTDTLTPETDHTLGQWPVVQVIKIVRQKIVKSATSSHKGLSWAPPGNHHGGEIWKQALLDNMPPSAKGLAMLLWALSTSLPTRSNFKLRS